MSSLIPGFCVLGMVALAALLPARHRTPPSGLEKKRIAASRALALATAVQAVHFCEEWLAGFPARFPAPFGLEPIRLPIFVVFNPAWIVMWIASVTALRRGRKAAFFAARFLAIAVMLNAAAHPVLATVSAGYFPGLYGSPFPGMAGLVLRHRLARAAPDVAGH